MVAEGWQESAWQTYLKDSANLYILYAITKVLLSKLELTFAKERVYHWHSAGDCSSQTASDNVVA